MFDEVCPQCQYAHNGHRCPAESLGEQFDNSADYSVTIRAVIKDGGIQLLVYLTGQDGMTVEFVDVATTAEVNMMWSKPVIK